MGHARREKFGGGITVVFIFNRTAYVSGTISGECDVNVENLRYILALSRFSEQQQSFTDLLFRCTYRQRMGNGVFT